MDFVAHVSPNMYIYSSFVRCFVIITKAMNILDCLNSGHGNLFGSSFERLLFARNSQIWLCFVLESGWSANRSIRLMLEIRSSISCSILVPPIKDIKRLQVERNFSELSAPAHTGCQSKAIWMCNTASWTSSSWKTRFQLGQHLATLRWRKATCF